MLKRWKDNVDKSFSENSHEIIQNDLPENAQYLMKSMLEKAIENGWEKFYLASGRLCVNVTDNEKKKQVYSDQEMVALFRKYVVEHQGSVMVLTRRKPQTNLFTKMLKELSEEKETKDRVTLRYAEDISEDLKPFWLDFSVTGSSYRVEIPDTPHVFGEDSRSPSLDVEQAEAIACANDNKQRVELLIDRFNYFNSLKKTKNSFDLIAA